MSHDVTSVLQPPSPSDPPQDQYVFIHDAVLESLTCGDTQIPASGLAGAIEKLKQKDSETGMTGFETQFHVCVSCLCIPTATKERPSILRAARSFIIAMIVSVQVWYKAEKHVCLYVTNDFKCNS